MIGVASAAIQSVKEITELLKDDSVSDETLRV